MAYKSSWEVRREGERAYELNGHSAMYDNPYKLYGTWDDTKHRRDYEDGVRDAERYEQERREEQRMEERREEERRIQRQREEYEQEQEYERYREEQEQFNEENGVD